jgi:hypothetical protein
VALATVAAWVGAGAPRSAFAQEPSDEDVAAARALFAEGRTLAEGGEWQTAADRFRRALALRPAPAIRYNLAAALAQLGRLVEAAEQLRAAVREASLRDAARAPSEELLGEIEPRIGRLTIRLQGEGRGTQVTLDGRLVSLARIGVATPVDPGSHVIVVRQGNLDATRQVNLPDGGSAEVVVPVPTGRPPVSGPGLESGPRESPRAVVPPPDRVARDEVRAQPAGGVGPREGLYSRA